MNRAKKKTSAVVVVGDEDVAAGFTQRVLMSMVVDISYLSEAVERVKIQVFAMAKEEGVHIPKEEDDEDVM